MALEIPGAVESEHMDHPDFRVGGKIFATLMYPSEKWGMVKLTPEAQADFLAKEPKMFRACNGVWGKRGATNVLLAAAKVGVLRVALKIAARSVAAGKGS